MAACSGICARGRSRFRFKRSGSKLCLRLTACQSLRTGVFKARVVQTPHGGFHELSPSSAFSKKQLENNKRDCARRKSGVE